MGPVEKLRARRRYREMARRLAELDALDGEYGLGAVGHTPPVRRRVAGSRTQRVLASLFALSMLGLVVVLGLASPRRSDDQRAVAGSSIEEPSSAVRRDRLRPSVPVVTTGAYGFDKTSPTGRPVTFDPCLPIHYVVNPDGMPPGGADELRGAVREIGDATGLQFVEDGVTSERLVEGRDANQLGRYGKGWAPVLIGWVDEAEFPELGGDVVGAANSVSAAPAGTEEYHYVTGQVAFDRTYFMTAGSDPGSTSGTRTTLLHELGHLVGLAHVDDRGEVMYPSADAVELGPGDLEGLAIVASGGCATGT